MASGGSPLIAFPIRLRPGQELMSCLLAFVKEQGLKSAFVLSCCGSVTQATLRMAEKGDNVEKDNNDIVHFKKHFEICALNGTISSNGEGCHLHTVLSDCNGSVVGGHVMGEMYIFTTAEIVLGECKQHVFTREIDHQTGYDELCIINRSPQQS